MHLQKRITNNWKQYSNKETRRGAPFNSQFIPPLFLNYCFTFLRISSEVIASVSSETPRFREAQCFHGNLPVAHSIVPKRLEINIRFELSIQSVTKLLGCKPYNVSFCPPPFPFTPIPRDRNSPVVPPLPNFAPFSFLPLSADEAAPPDEVNCCTIRACPYDSSAKLSLLLSTVTKTARPPPATPLQFSAILSAIFWENTST